MDENQKKSIKFKELKEISPMINVLKVVSIAYAITIIVFLGYAMLLTYTDITEKQMPIVVIATIGVSVILAGYDVAKSVNSKGWLWGMTSGLVYAVIAIIIEVIVTKGNIQINFSMIITIVMCVAGGGLGGMIGINRKK